MQRDDALLRAWVQEQDSGALATLFQRYADFVFATCLRVTGNHADAEDIAQQCFVELASNASSISGSVGVWLQILARSRARNMQRESRRRKKREADAVMLNGMSNKAAFAEISPIVDDAIGQLPPDLRAPLVMHYLAGRTQAEVADELGIDQTTVSRRLEKGVVRLREEAKKSGVIVSIALLLLFLKEGTVMAAPPTLVANLGRMALTFGIQDPAGIAAQSAEIASHATSGPHTGASSSILGTVTIGAVAVTLVSLVVWFGFGGALPGAEPSANRPAAALASGVQDQSMPSEPSNESDGSDESFDGADSDPRNGVVVAPAGPRAKPMTAVESSTGDKPEVEQQSPATVEEEARGDYFAGDPSFIQGDRRKQVRKQ